MRPTIEAFKTQTLDREWGEEIIVAATDDYLGKVLKYKRGKAGGLQFHRTKDETFYLLEGLGVVEFVGPDGDIVEKVMNPGESYRIPPGAPHRFYAAQDCIVFETSTPVYNDRVRCEEEYGKKVIGENYGLPTTK
jgi:mannose-6-phosphate isomerase-like protein (cupin superfamily)